LFSIIKTGKEEPKVEVDTDVLIDLEPQSFVRRLPGITNANFYRVIHSCESIYDLSQKSLSEMEEMIGKSNGKKLYDFFNSSSVASFST
jgi:ERCC4-type nuclease